MTRLKVVLLELAIDGHERFKAGGNLSTQQIAVSFAGPSHLGNRLGIVAW